jgi:hypothetical protein
LDRLGAAIIVPHLITKKVLLFKKIDAGLAGIEQIGELGTSENKKEPGRGG